MSAPAENTLFPPDPAWEAVVAAVQAYCLREHKRQATALTIHLSHGHARKIPLPLVEDAPPPRPEEWASGRTPRHLSDFQLVYWPGLGRFRFTRQQSRAVAVLWQAMLDGTHFVDQLTLLRAAGSDASRCSDLFRRCEAWGTLIIRGEGALYRLRATEEADAAPD